MTMCRSDAPSRPRCLIRYPLVFDGHNWRASDPTGFPATSIPMTASRPTNHLNWRTAMRQSIADPGLATPTARPAIATIFRRLPFALALTVLAGCASETLFQSNFDSTAIGQPPAAVQATGTANVFGPPGSVVVVGAPGSASGHWLQVSRASLPGNQAPIAGMVGMLSAVRGPGQYSFICAMFMPTGSGLATLSFEPVPQHSPAVYIASCFSTSPKTTGSASTTLMPPNS